jgi:hypothetical protein
MLPCNCLNRDCRALRRVRCKDTAVQRADSMCLEDRYKQRTLRNSISNPRGGRFERYPAP